LAFESSRETESPKGKCQDTGGKRMNLLSATVGKERRHHPRVSKMQKYRRSAGAGEEVFCTS
jgi:hypothetical protein